MHAHLRSQSPSITWVLVLCAALAALAPAQLPPPPAAVALTVSAAGGDQGAPVGHLEWELAPLGGSPVLDVQQLLVDGRCHLTRPVARAGAASIALVYPLAQTLPAWKWTVVWTAVRGCAVMPARLRTDVVGMSGAAGEMGIAWVPGQPPAILAGDGTTHPMSWQPVLGTTYVIELWSDASTSELRMWEKGLQRPAQPDAWGPSLGPANVVQLSGPDELEFEHELSSVRLEDPASGTVMLDDQFARAAAIQPRPGTGGYLLSIRVDGVTPLLPGVAIAAPGSLVDLELQQDPGTPIITLITIYAHHPQPVAADPFWVDPGSAFAVSTGEEAPIIGPVMSTAEGLQFIMPQLLVPLVLQSYGYDASGQLATTNAWLLRN